MGVTTAEKFAGVVIFGDLDEDSLTVLEWVFDYLKIKKDYKLRIIHVIKMGNQDPPETDDDMNWDEMEKHFKSRAREGTFDRFQDLGHGFEKIIRTSVFRGEDSQETLQCAINSLRGLHTLVLGWPKQEGAERQKISVTGECVIVVVPKKDASVTMDLASVVAVPPAPSAPQPLENLQSDSKNHKTLKSSKNNSSSGEGSSTRVEAKNPPDQEIITASPVMKDESPHGKKADAKKEK